MYAADVDGIQIAFDESSLTTLKIVIGAILFGIALDTSLDDFRRAARRPGAAAVSRLAMAMSAARNQGAAAAHIGPKPAA